MTQPNQSPNKPSRMAAAAQAWRGLPPSIKHILTALVAAVLAVGVTLTVDQPGPTPSNPHPGRTIKVTLGGPKATVPGQVPQHTITLTPTAQKIVTAAGIDEQLHDKTGVEAGLRDAAPPTPAAQAQAEAVKPAGQPAVPAQVPLAAASEPGCRTSFVRNYSSRHGDPIDLGVIHWTGSTPTRDASGGLAIVHWFDTPAAQASSNYITDQAGRCWYVVPETSKAWTQAAANPWAVSVEIVNPGILPLFQTAAARQAVIRLMIGWHHRWHIPYRYARVNTSCVPLVTGFLAHRDLGACGGGHPDVGTFPLAQLIQQAAAQDHGAGARTVTAAERGWCRALTYWRTHGRPRGTAEKLAVRRRNLLARHHVTCVNGQASAR